MPFKDPEKQAAYLRRWRQKRQYERIKRGKHIARLLFSLYFSNNPNRHKEKARQLLSLVFGRLLQPDEEEYLLAHFFSFPRKFLEALTILWRENYRREVSAVEFVNEILLSPEWETCPECGRPYPAPEAN
ncbi:MAG: hypothetical protein K6U74_21330 [Firmicutes bacterium]|nr:hypothetical protein [Bacillota bacterium]